MTGGTTKQYLRGNVPPDLPQWSPPVTGGTTIVNQQRTDARN